MLLGKLAEAAEVLAVEVMVAGDMAAEEAMVEEAKVERKVLIILTVLTLPRNGGACLCLSNPKFGKPETRIG